MYNMNLGRISAYHLVAFLALPTYMVVDNSSQRLLHHVFTAHRLRIPKIIFSAAVEKDLFTSRKLTMKISVALFTMLAGLAAAYPYKKHPDR
ncbi:hypothetical protein CP532_5963, partial [Ophiocordyceps camponoti-leonardi (nom. inval.)]